MWGRMALRKLIKSFAGYISAQNGYTEELEAQVEYALRITIFETLKILGVIIIFSVFGYPVEVITAVAVMSIIRPFIGGYHEDTQLKCFAAVLIIIACTIYLSTNLQIDIISKLILGMGSLYCIWHQAPVVHPKMALTKPELIKRNRNVGLLLTALFIIISILTNRYDSISNSILWIVVFQTLLMFNKRGL
jgi:accessory gene regulator B